MEKLADLEMSWGDRLREEGRKEGRKEGHKEGHKEGRKEGEQEMLLHLLSLLFGELPASLVKRITAITDEGMLAMVAKQILVIKDLDQLVLPDEATTPHETGN